VARNALTRRGFLRMAAGAAAAAGVGCNSGSSKRKSTAARTGGKGPPTLRIAQWTHFVPAYDAWFDQDYTQRWGKEHGVEVIVDHISAVSDLPHRAAAEVIGGRGHDLFAFLAPPSTFEDEVLDLRDVVEEVAARVGPLTPFVERVVLNPKTKKYIGFPEYWAPFPVVYRTDLWQRVGMPSGPDTWEDLLEAAPRLKAAGHPIGLAFSPDVDANWSLIGLMLAHGASIQDEMGNVTINSPATVEAVKLGTALYRTGMTEDVLNWDSASNNRFMASGQGSMTLNPLSATRAVEKQDPGLAAKLALAPVPAGPASRIGVHSVTSVYVIWRFAENQEAAKQFLVDLAVSYREAFLRSELFNVPAFPGAAADLADLFAGDDQAQPPGKYGLLARATSWSTNVGHPGTANAAIDEVFNQFLIPKMFAAAARGEMSPDEAVRTAESEIKPIFDRWRERGKI
jgi:multiple sugar transport system substrate-binding protein